MFGEYFGFTDEEVDSLYEKYQHLYPNIQVSRKGLQEWYDGYFTISGKRLYNPRSVVMALRFNQLSNYWTSSGPYDELFYYIRHDIDQIRNDLALMITGEGVDAKVDEFAASAMELKSRNQIYSAMVVYGLLTFTQGKVYIPNRELMLKYEELLQSEKSLGYVYQLRKTDIFYTKLKKGRNAQMIDYIIKNGWIINGKRQKPFHGDISIKDGKIEEMKEHIEIPADFPDEKILDAQDGYVTPGFIDIHRHGDWQALHHGDDELLNRQGLTTVVNGNCGLSVAPAGKKHTEEIYSFLGSVTGKMDGNPLSVMDSMENYLDALSKTSRSVNTGMLAGNGTIRASVKGYDSGKLSDEELHQVWNTLEESLAAGALGVSLGVAYAPEFEYDRDGLVEALQPLKGTDIPITTHIRNEGDGILLALQEVISVAEELQIPLHVSHMKCIGRKNWGDTPRKILKMLDEAGERGLKVDFDLYPYLTGSTQLVHLLPPEFQEGGTDAICKRLQDPVCRKALTETLKQPSDIFENIVELAGFERIYASTLHTDQYRPYAGKSIAEISGNLGRDPYETLYDILLAERCEVTMLDTIASEDDMLYFLKDDRANLISDAIYPAGGKYHPRVYGAFPKLLTDYVRDRKIFSIEDAIYKMTAKPAQVLGLNRGILDKGMPADINMFHLDHLQVHADFQNPDQFCTGFDYVFVNGKMVVSHDTYINQENNMTGMVLKRNQP